MIKTKNEIWKFIVIFNLSYSPRSSNRRLITTYPRISIYPFNLHGSIGDVPKLKVGESLLISRDSPMMCKRTVPSEDARAAAESIAERQLVQKHETFSE